MKPLSGIAKWPRWMFLGGLMVFAISYFMRDRLPPPSEIDPRLMQSPVQKATKAGPIGARYNGKLYSIKPRYDYELWGLVVSSRDLDRTWYNVDYFRDPMQVKDICVIWGGNLLSSDYRRMHFESGFWTCYASWTGKVTFIPDALSNNHLLPGNEAILAAFRNVRRGDQIHFKGQLVDYVAEGRGERRTSTTRSDAGSGACEVVYLEEFEIIKEGNLFWRALYMLSKLAIAAAVLIWIYFAFFAPEPVPPKQEQVTR